MIIGEYSVYKELIDFNNFYVYVYLDPRKPGQFTYKNITFLYEPLYVGRGINKRYLFHIYYANNNYNDFKSRKLRKILNSGNNPIVIFYQINLSFKEANDTEISLIKEIGRFDLKTGPLLNMADGGEGLLNPSQEHRDIISQWNKERWKNDDDFRKYISEKRKLSSKKQMIKQWKDVEYRNMMKKRIETWKNKTTDEKECHRLKVSAGTKTALSNLSKEEKQRLSELRSKNLRKNWYVKRIKDTDWILIDNMPKFCSENNLCTSHMYAVSKGKLKKHKGWLCRAYLN